MLRHTLVVLTDQEVAEAVEAANRIVDRARRRRWRDTYDEQSTLTSHQVGALGERAFAKWCGRAWTPSYVPQGTDTDVAGVEVKTQGTQDPDALLIPTAKVLDVPYVAVHAQTRHEYELKGWTHGHAALAYPARSRRPGWPAVHAIPYVQLRSPWTVPGMTDDRRIVQSARAYMAARLALMAADSSAMLARTWELDAAFHDLVIACGIPCEDVGCWHREHDDRELPATDQPSLLDTLQREDDR